MPEIYPADGTLLRANGEVYVMVSGERQRISDPEALSELTKVVEDSDVGTIDVPTMLTLSEEQLAAVPQGPDFVAEALIEATRQDEVTSNMPRRYMWTRATVSQESGIVSATTRVWTTQPWVGFTGGAMLLLAGQNGEVIGYTNLIQIGVDGFRIPFMTSDRPVPWQQNLSPEVTRRTQHIEIVHTHAPKPRLEAILTQMRDAGKLIGEIAVAVRAITG